MTMLRIFTLSLVMTGLAASQSAFANPDLLSGDKKLACEAMLCLASGQRPSECTPSIKKYFSIKKKKPSKTLKARKNFLKLCPTGDGGATAERVQQVYGRCDLGQQNANCIQLGYRGEAVGGFCSVTQGNQCTNFTESLYLNANGQVAAAGDYGLCYRQTLINGPFGGYTPANNNRCIRFTVQVPDDFGASEAAAALAAIQ